MRTTLQLIRHGETSWNALRKIQGTQNIFLSDAGKNQAEDLSESLSGNFSCVYTSPLNRAFETACIICKPTSLEPIIENGLAEIDFGKWEGLTFKEVKATYPEAFSLWKTDDTLAPLVEGEKSLKAASLRAKNCILEIVQKHPGENIVMVSHGGLIKAALIGLLDLKMTMYHHIALGNTAVTTLQFDEHLSPILIGLNDTHHLKETVPFSI